MNKLIAIGQASKLLGVTIQTLRNWLYGSRSKKNKKLLEPMQEVINDNLS